MRIGTRKWQFDQYFAHKPVISQYPIDCSVARHGTRNRRHMALKRDL
jgi:hypothetical protein